MRNVSAIKRERFASREAHRVEYDVNSRCHVDLIDLQTQLDDELKFILNYQDFLTKFVVLKPLKFKRAADVAYHVLDIFCMLGSPHILQSGNRRKFRNNVVKEIVQMWSNCKLVHGKVRNSQSQEWVEMTSRDVEDMQACWMRGNNTNKCTEGLRFFQFQKNNRLHSGIGRLHCGIGRLHSGIGRLHSGIGRSQYKEMVGEQRYNDTRGQRRSNEVWAQLETEEQWRMR